MMKPKFATSTSSQQNKQFKIQSNPKKTYKPLAALLKNNLLSNCGQQQFPLLEVCVPNLSSPLQRILKIFNLLKYTESLSEKGFGYQLSKLTNLTSEQLYDTLASINCEKSD